MDLSKICKIISLCHYFSNKMSVPFKRHSFYSAYDINIVDKVSTYKMTS